MLQSFIPSVYQEALLAFGEADRGMPLAGGRNIAASNIGNIDRQTLFHPVRRLDNSRRKCRGNGEGLIKKYLQSAVITQWTRLARARALARMKGREAEGKAFARSCQVCQRRSLLLASSRFLVLPGFPIDRQPSLSSEGTSRHGGKVINVCAFETRMRVKMKNRMLPDTKIEEDVVDGGSRTEGHVSGLVGGAPVYAFFNSGHVLLIPEETHVG